MKRSLCKFIKKAWINFMSYFIIVLTGPLTTLLRIIKLLSENSFDLNSNNSVLILKATPYLLQCTQNSILTTIKFNLNDNYQFPVNIPTETSTQFNSVFELSIIFFCSSTDIVLLHPQRSTNTQLAWNRLWHCRKLLAP